MGSPYLNSGEAIILTTNRVSVDAVLYDIMLTSERIFLTDNRNARFEPRIIPLSTILSVQGGKTPAHDPVITLLFRAGDEAHTRQPLNLIFTQDPNESRKAERDDWLRSLIQLSISQHERETVPVIPVVPEITGETGLRPTVRHYVAPERVRPLSNVIDHQTEPVPVTVIPDEAEGGGATPARATPLLRVTDEKTGPETVSPEPATDSAPLHETPSPVRAPAARVIIPQIIEELLPARTRAAPPVELETVPVADSDHETLTQSIRTAVQSLTLADERAPEHPPVSENVAVSETVSIVETVPEKPAVVSPLAAPEPEEIPEIIRALRTGAAGPVPSEQPDAATTDSAPEPVQESPEAGIREIPESHDALTIPENVMPESAGYPSREAAATEAPPVRHPIPPAQEIRPLRTMLVYAAVLLLVIALAAAGALLLLSQGPGPTGNTVTPSPTNVQDTTLLPETAQTITVPPSTLSPFTTPIATSAPSHPVSPVPQEGVWVRVNSTAYYSGKVGNLDRIQTVSGIGDNFYKVLKSDRVIQVSVQKQDNSGALLAIAIYRNGTLIGTRSVTSPMGAVDLLIDPITARPPGLDANDTLPEHAANPAGFENY